MSRITWLDASRGLAIILLVAMHYVGALESRNFMSTETLHVLYGILRLATPFFMFTFGLAFFITASKKINRSGIGDYYKNNVLKRIAYIFIGREVIVLILSFRYPSMAENLWSILLFQKFSSGGEILIFYFFAFLVAPLNVMFLQRVKVFVYILFWLGVYSVSYFIGANFVDSNSNNVLRFLFYDIYPFFPFLVVVATAMLVAKYFIVSQNQNRFLKYGLGLGGIFLVVGFLHLNMLSSNIWESLASAEFKKPPNLGYMLFYLGEVFIVICLVALANNKIPNVIHAFFSLLGRNTLVAYVMHYTFFASVPLAAILGGGALFEVLSLLLICGLVYWGIYLWDARKQKRKTA